MVEDVSGRLTAWIAEHFDFVGDPPVIRCRRCSAGVGYPTKHAVVRHGDPIRIVPMADTKLGSRSGASAF